jgi:L-lactate dehydrogenase complex protein LldE
MIKVFYNELFQNSDYGRMARVVAEKTFEFSDFLVNRLGASDVGARFDARVTFHDGCHGLRELGIKSQPRVLLSHVRGLTLLEMSDVETCCGFGGTFATTYPSISTAMGERKCQNVIDSGADYIVSNDSSCLMHLQGMLSRQRERIKTLHLAEVLAST